MARTEGASGHKDSTAQATKPEGPAQAAVVDGDHAQAGPRPAGSLKEETSARPRRRAAHRRARRPKFEIGIVMAGAISAGAYSAGVMDFLIQALDAWQKAKDDAKDRDCPRHDVVLKVISGASAGGMTAALATGMLCESFDHVVSDQADRALNNKLFDSWVRKIDIRRLLETRDLDEHPGEPVRSFLDSTVLDEIAADAFHFSKDAPAPPKRPYLAHPLHVVLTLTNLRGVPYKIDLKGSRATNYQMRMHADRLHFTLGDEGDPSPSAIEPRRLAGRKYDQYGWEVLRTAALATGAFPFGLAPRALHREVIEYANRTWPVPGPSKVNGVHCCESECAIPPYWPDAMPDDFDFLCVDGGLIDNEPLEAARRILADERPHNLREGKRARRAILMVDPFPNVTPFPVDYRDHRMDGNPGFSLVRMAGALFASLVDQARFKPEELELAMRPDVYSRFLVEPVRYDVEGHQEMEYGIACGSLGGFGGFLSEKFRRHDYQLGRRNCQQFLRKHFVLPRENPLFHPWSKTAEAAHMVYWSRDGKKVRPFNHPLEDDDRAHLPIIPLVDEAAETVPAPAWPEYTAEELDELKGLLSQRLDRVVKRLIDQNATGWPSRLVLRMAWPLERRKLEQSMFDRIEGDLARRRLLRQGSGRQGGG